MAMRLTICLHVLDKLGNTEDIVHFLKRQAFCLGDEEPDEEEHAEAEGAIYKERSGVDC